MSQTFQFQAIGHIHSPFKEKFGIPRQSGLASSASGTLELLPPYDHVDSVRGLERFSHIWVIFVFHKHLDRDWSALVRPPRLGGNDKAGVFASRSPYRPNMIGQSVVKLDAIRSESGHANLSISGFDLLDGTPVLDIKPYIPYNDALPGASGGFAPTAPDIVLDVVFSPQAEAQCQQLEGEQHPKLRQLISEVLCLDPRPAYRRAEVSDRVYGIRLYDVDVRFRVDGCHAEVVEIASAS